MCQSPEPALYKIVKGSNLYYGLFCYKPAGLILKCLTSLSKPEAAAISSACACTSSNFSLVNDAGPRATPMTD